MSKKKRNTKKRTVKKANVQNNSMFRSPLFTQSNFDTAYKQFNHFLNLKNYPEALKHAEIALTCLPKDNNKKLAIFLSNIATCYVYESNYERAVVVAKQSMQIDPDFINNYDVLSHAYGKLNDADNVRQYGNQALQVRDKLFTKPIADIDFPELPPAPSEASKDRNIISYSLFGDLPRYCEMAFFNIEKAKQYYPHWTCRFYLGDDVPENVVMRLKQTDAQVVHVNETQKKLIGTMWRFLPLDDDIDRVIFRDIDSQICEAEALAVAEWVASGKQFHTMRDWPTHTEIILAGMWGAVVGSLTTQGSFEALMQDFMQKHKGSNYFADQYFLRETIWSVVRQSLCQHDSQFGVAGSTDFPTKDRGESSHIGSDLGTSYFEAIVNKEEGMVKWRLVYKDNEENIYCEYQSMAKNKKVKVYIAKKVIKMIDDHILIFRIAD